MLVLVKIVATEKRPYKTHRHTFMPAAKIGHKKEVKSQLLDV
jgi:hypothetical protein